MEFLASIGKNNSEKLSQDDVRSIINGYAKENKLIHPEKKKTIRCDARLEKLFKRKTINKFRVYFLLEDHFTENQDASEEDVVEYDSENDNANIPSACKRQKRVDVEKKPEKVENDVDQCCFAAIIDKNLKLVYLKRSVLYELLKEPESFEEKAIGSFVRAKSDPYDYRSRNSYQLMQVKVVPDISELQSNNGDVKMEMKNDEGSPTPILQSNNAVPGTAGKQLEDGLEGKTWWILGPGGEKYKSSLSFMKHYNDSSAFASKFKVWKEDQSEKDAISLPEAISNAFPKM
ncbi:hypothetical protein BUALT_Bualt15G0094700 [Buddleja alternifolia]|uniref:Uncharacterized protein n=1 Tax=Buddleja alternifolia TaxID=168488 RepID=A0AAV6WEG4_9LAMI|nr:hypothetical protein BUALT_Bualt15G0094700 [Buddleja alternifolia]